MKPPRQYKHPPRRRIVPNVRPSHLPKPPADAYVGCDPARGLDNAIAKIEWCAQILNGLAQNGEIGGSSTIKPMQEALRWMRGVRAGMDTQAAPVPDVAAYGRLD